MRNPANESGTVFPKPGRRIGLHLLSLIAFLSLLVACAGGSKPDDADAFQTLRLYYGTNRNVENGPAPGDYYGPRRGQLDYGIATLQFTGTGDNAHVAAIRPMRHNAFLASLRSDLQSAERPELLVFVHGFNRSFDQASRRMSEFLEIADFDGVPVLWSWPSSNNPVGYLEDETNVRWTEPDFARFLTDLLEHSGAEVIHLAGHSLGARALCEVLVSRILPEQVSIDTVGEVVLLAPDIDSDIFVRDLAPELVQAGLDVTLYTSANDTAMAGARALRHYPRAGDSRLGPLVVSGIETIDVTSANQGGMRHSYFERSEVVARDLRELIEHRKKAADRPNLVSEETPDGTYWRLQSDH